MHNDTRWLNVQRAQREMDESRALRHKVATSGKASDLDLSTCDPIPHIFRIPAELRNRIYRFALVSRGAKAIYTHPLRKEPVLLLTSRRIRREAMPIYYGYNTFLVSEAVTMPVTLRGSIERQDISCGPPAYRGEDSLLRQWLQWLGPERARMIRHFRIVYNSCCDDPPTFSSHYGDEYRGAWKHYVSWQGFATWATEAGGEADGARVAARLMLGGMREDGLRLGSVEPVLSIRMQLEEQEWQVRWVRAMEEVKKEMAREIEEESVERQP